MNDAEMMKHVIAKALCLAAITFAASHGFAQPAGKVAVGAAGTVAAWQT